MKYQKFKTELETKFFTIKKGVLVFFKKTISDLIKSILIPDEFVGWVLYIIKRSIMLRMYFVCILYICIVR